MKTTTFGNTFYTKGLLKGAKLPQLLTTIIICILNLLQLNANAAVNTYTFSQTSTTYSAISTGTSLGSTTSDEQVFIGTTAGTTTFSSGVASGAGFPIGFNFNYNGVTYSSFAVNTNGFIVLGNGTFAIAGSSSGFTTPISNSQTSGLVGAISAVGYDIQAQSGATLRYLSSGTAPNRILVVQWAGYRRFVTGGVSGENLNFQIKLTETTNVVDIIYGAMTNVNTSIWGVQVGLRGSTNSDFSNRFVTNGTNTWATSGTGSTNIDVAQLKNIFVPTSGQKYSWDPCGAAALSAPTTTSNSICGIGTVGLSAVTGSGGTSCRWYDASTGGNLLTTALSYSPSFTATGSTTYYVSSVNANLCESPTRTAVTATTNPTVIFDNGTASGVAPVASPASICLGSSSVLSASPARVAISSPASSLGIPQLYGWSYTIHFRFRFFNVVK